MSRACIHHNAYIGKHYIHGKVYTERYPAIVDEETFNRVQKRLAENRKYGARKNAKIGYLLTGKLFCGHCGSSMQGRSGNGNGGKFHYYACSKKCGKKYEKKVPLERYVVQQVKKYLFEKTNLDRLSELVYDYYKTKYSQSSIAD